jgi:NAD(P)-dependent dehydrogenase (short-subunit alcohol dehydrogenase family)
VLLCAQAAARQMVRQGTGGRIGNISSVHAVYSIKTAAVYDAAKAGVVRLSATMALERAPHHIRGQETIPANGPQLQGSFPAPYANGLPSP